MSSLLPIPSSDLPIRVPELALNEIRQLYSFDELPPEAAIELSIQVREGKISIRDLSAYMELIDRVYGRLTTDEGLRSYALQPDRHLRFAEIRKESPLELALRELASNAHYVTVLMIIAYIVRWLPKAYEHYEQGRFIRGRRKRLREQANEDQSLSGLDETRKEQLIRFIDELLEQERRRIPRARRFSKEDVREVAITVKVEGMEKADSEMNADGST